MTSFINLVSLSVSVIIFALFSGFYLSQEQLMAHQQTQFMEYLSANIEKSELISSESSFLNLKQVSRPRLEEVESLLSHHIQADIALNYTMLFSAESLHVFDEPFANVYPVFLQTFNFDSQQLKLIKHSYNAHFQGFNVLVNQAFIEEMNTKFSFNDVAKIPLTYRLEINNEHTQFEQLLTLSIVGVVNEMNYLTTPKIYYSQASIDDYFINTMFMDDITIYDYLADLPATDVLSGFSYRLYFISFDDFQRAQTIVSSLEGETSRLILTDEHLTRQSSLHDILTFMNMVMLISVVIVVVSLLLINLTIIHLDMKKANAKNALLYFFGAKTWQIFEIYTSLNFYLVAISLLSLAITPTLAKLITRLINKYLRLDIVIKVPLLIFKDVPLLLPILIFSILFYTSSVITLINLLIKNQKSLIKRLAHHD